MSKKISAEDRYIDLLLRALTRVIYGDESIDPYSPIITIDMLQEGGFWPKYAHTMIGLKRLRNIIHCYKKIVADNIEGDCIETGVWRGGASILMAGLNSLYNENRTIYVCDSFEGLPKPDPKYKHDKGDLHHTKKELAVSLHEVRGNFLQYGLLSDNVKFVKGFFKDTLHLIDVDKIAILRLDGDMYQSTIEALEALYHKVVEGGFVIIDDYNLLDPCKEAVTDFRKKYGIEEVIRIIDHSGVYWRVTEPLIKN